MVHRCLYILIFFCSSLISFAQNINELQNEIDKSEAEIQRISALLASNRDKQIESNTKIALLEKRLKLRQNLVKQTSFKIYQLNKKLNSYDSKVLISESLIDSIKSIYNSLLLSYSYINLSNDNFPELNGALLSTVTFSFSNSIDSLDSVISNTGIARSEVVRQKLEMNKLLQKRKSEVDQIIEETSELDSIKKSLQITESKMLSQIESHRSKISQLQREIENLIKIQNSNLSLSENNALTASFKQSAGNLPSPLSVQAKIVDEYGTHDHPTIKGVKVSNKGVNLAFCGSSDVKSIANGEVTGIYTIANMGNTVLIRHGQFISVYSNLNTVFVSKGDKVIQGKLIGCIKGPENEQMFFHFEIWNELETLNPVQWVKF